MLETLVERADGVPLFLEELVRAVVEDALDGVAPAAIPTSLQDSLMARLDRLGPAREVAQIASVLGREFDFGLLQAVSELPEDKLELTLASLADAELLYARGLPPESTYLFKHTLMQDAAYQSLLKSRRRDLHRAAAEALTARSAAGAAEHPELLAQHWEAAGEVERAVAELKRAGDRARHRYALAEAERHYTHAIELLGWASGDDRAPRAGALAPDPAGRRPGSDPGLHIAGARAQHSRAQALFARLGGTQGHAIVPPVRRGRQERARRAPGAREAAERLLEAGLREGSRGALTWAHCLAGSVAFHAGDLARAVEHLEQAVACFREGGLRGLDQIRPGPMIHEEPPPPSSVSRSGLPERAEAEILRARSSGASDSPPDRFAGWAQLASSYVHAAGREIHLRCIERAYAVDRADRPAFSVDPRRDLVAHGLAR